MYLRVADVLEDHRLGVQLVERDVEEALDLVRVQVEREHAVGTGGGDEVRHEARGDRHAGLVLAVLARVAVVGDHGGDARGAAALERVHDDEQLHVRLVRRGAAALDHEHVAPAHALLHLAERLAVREVLDVDLVERLAEVARHLLRERQVRRSGEHHEIAVFQAVHRRFFRCCFVHAQNWLPGEDSNLLKRHQKPLC